MRRWLLVASLAPMTACTLALPLDGLTGGDAGGAAGTDASADGPSEAAAETSGTESGAGGTEASADGPVGDVGDAGDVGAGGDAFGGCPHDCGGGNCVAGVCAPFTIATGQDVPRDLAVSGGIVYWTTHSDAGVVASCPVTGCSGSPTVYASNLVLAAGIDVAGSNLFFGTFGNSPPDGGSLDPGAGIFSCSTSGCSMMPTPLDPAPGAITGVTTDGQMVYWSDVGHGEILSCAVGGCGGHPTVIASGVSSPWYGIKTDAANVYFVGHADGNVYVCPKSGCAGGTPTQLATGLAGPYDLAVDSSAIYFTSYDPANPNTPGSVFTCPLGGCAGQPTVFAANQVTPQGIAVDASNVYWCDYANGSSTIDYCPKSGCPANGPNVLASGQAGAFLLTLDASFVYWTNTAGGEIMRVAKP